MKCFCHQFFNILGRCHVWWLRKESTVGSASVMTNTWFHLASLCRCYLHQLACNSRQRSHNDSSSNPQNGLSVVIYKYFWTGWRLAEKASHGKLASAVPIRKLELKLKARDDLFVSKEVAAFLQHKATFGITRAKFYGMTKIYHWNPLFTNTIGGFQMHKCWKTF